MRANRFLLFLTLASVVFCSRAPRVQAQSSTIPHQHGAASPLIDGAVHPELIPDSLAYRLYLVAVSTQQNPTDAERKGQQAHLMKTGLQSSDRDNLFGVLSDFRTQYDELVRQYNESAKAALARNEMADIHSLLRSLDALVQSTRDMLKLRLTLTCSP